VETPLSLELLHIECVQAPPDPAGIDYLTRLSVLQSLILGECKGMGRLLNSLAHGFLKCETATLHTLVIHQKMNIDQPFNIPLDALLAVVPALKTLSITAHKTERASMWYIRRNGATLSCLHLDHFPDFYDYIVVPNVDRYTTAEIGALGDSCSNIEELGINLFELGFDVVDLLQPFHVCDA
jgi:hypothetical protein